MPTNRQAVIEINRAEFEVNSAHLLIIIRNVLAEAVIDIVACFWIV